MRRRLLGTVGTIVTILALVAAGPGMVAASPVVCVATGRPTAGHSRAGGAPVSRGPKAPVITTSQPGQAYIHTSTTDNISCNYSYLDNPALNGQPNMKFFAIANSRPYGYGPTVADKPQGVWYDDNVGHFQRGPIGHDCRRGL